MTPVALPAILDGQQLIVSVGLIGLLLIVFAETGLLLGFFLPGDSLLFAAGYAASPDRPFKDLHPSIAVVVVGCVVMAVVGGQTGYLIGRKAGPVLFAREDSRFFKKAYVTKAEEVIEHYGVGRALVLARFIPIVRTFINPLVGAGQLPAREFALWNAVGGVLWGAGVTTLGYYLGQVDAIGKNLEVFAVIVVAISLIPILNELRKNRKRLRS